MSVTSTPAQLSRLRRVFDYHRCAGEPVGRSDGQPTDPLDAFAGPLADELRRLQLPPSAVHILAAAPLASTAWTAAGLSPAARQRPLAAGMLPGITVGSAVWQTLSVWLERRPDHHLLQIWEDYVGALSWVMSVENLTALQTITGRRCRAILRAASGCVGISRFRPADHPLLRRLDRAFCFPVRSL